MARPSLPSFFGRGDDPFGSLFREVQKTFEDFSQRTPFARFTSDTLSPKVDTPVAAVDPLSPRADPPLEISAPQQPHTADQDKGVFSALKRIPDLLRPEPPAPTGETPRPPMPVGTASPEIK